MTTEPEASAPAPVPADPATAGLDSLIKAARDRQIEADIAGDSMMIEAFGRAYDRLLDRRLALHKDRNRGLAAALDDVA